MKMYKVSGWIQGTITFDDQMILANSEQEAKEIVAHCVASNTGMKIDNLELTAEIPVGET